MPEPSEALDEVYKEYQPPTEPSSTSSPTPAKTEAQHSLLLTRDAVPAILSRFELKASAGADLYRAVEQARARVSSGRDDL